MSFDFVSVFVAGVVAVFVWILIYAFREAFRAVASSRWPEVDATVVESGWKRMGGPSTYTTAIRFTYKVDGREFQGQRVAFWGLLNAHGENTAKEWSDRWLPGQAVTVHYHPRRPELAVLLPGWNWRIAGSLLMAIVVFGPLIAAAIYIALP